MGGWVPSAPDQEVSPCRHRSDGRRGVEPRRPKRILNCRPSEKTEDDFTFEHAAGADAVAAAATIPASKDLRAAWWKINDQGSTGSCVGWGTADGLLRWHFVQAGQHQEHRLLSPRFIWMASKETDQFTTPADVVHRERGHEPQVGARHRPQVRRRARLGAALRLGALYPGDTKTFYALASQLKILTYFNLGTTISNWKTWLATKGPILTRLDVDDGVGRRNRQQGQHGRRTQPNTTRGGHCVAIVGYKKDRFIVRNSWGTSWGDKGFAYASLDYAQAAFTEAYGIQV